MRTPGTPYRKPRLHPAQDRVLAQLRTRMEEYKRLDVARNIAADLFCGLCPILSTPEDRAEYDKALTEYNRLVAQMDNAGFDLYMAIDAFLLALEFRDPARAVPAA